MLVGAYGAPINPLAPVQTPAVPPAHGMAGVAAGPLQFAGGAQGLGHGIGVGGIPAGGMQAHARYNNMKGELELPSKSIMPHMEAANRIDAAIKSKSQPAGVVVPDRGATMFSRWPVQLTGGDERDQYYQIRASLINDQGVVPGQGRVDLPPEYFGYLDRKRQMVQKADFESWLMTQMDLSSPEKMEYWRAKFPDIFQAREELWRRNQDMITQAAMINMRGPISRDDYLFLYMLARGHISLPTVPAYRPDSVRTEQSFKRGLFSFYRMLPWLNVTNTTLRRDETLVGRIDWTDPLNQYVNNTLGVTKIPNAGDDITNFANFYGQIPHRYGFARNTHFV